MIKAGRILMWAVAVSAACYAPAAAAATCELRILPTEKVEVITKVWPGLIGSVLNGQDQPKSIFFRDLDGATQAEAVAQIPDLAARLKLPPGSVHKETTSADHRTAKKSKQRLTQSATPCYAELVITSLVYTDNAVNGRRIGSMALLRRFDQSSPAPIVREIGGSAKLTLYPSPKAADEEKARQELISAFQQSIIEAAAKFIK